MGVDKSGGISGDVERKFFFKVGILEMRFEGEFNYREKERFLDGEKNMRVKVFRWEGGIWSMLGSDRGLGLVR